MQVPALDNIRTSIQGGGGANFSGTPFRTEQPNQERQFSNDYLSGQNTAVARGVGSSLDKIAEVHLRAQQEAQQSADEIRVLDAVNRAKEKQYDLTYANGTGYLSQKGLAAQDRGGDKDLATEYVGAFQEHADEISKSLGNDRQRLLFAKHAQSMRQEIYGGAERHMATEFTRYKASVYDGVVSNAERDITVNYNDTAVPSESNPQGGAVYRAAAQIEAAVRAKARLAGLSQLEADGEVRKATSGAHKLAIEAALSDRNVGGADDYLKKFGWQMNASDLLRAKSEVKRETNAVDATEISASAVKSVAPKIFAGDSDRLLKITEMAESKGQHFNPKTGKPTESRLTDAQGNVVPGAVGLYQVMRSTAPEAAKLAGLPWNSELFNRARTGDPIKDKEAEEYNRALGSAYYNSKLVKYNGDYRKAWAAYNAGDKWVDAAIKGAEKDAATGAYRSANGQDPMDWFSKLNNDGRSPSNRAQTRDYVTNNAAAFEAGEGRVQAPTIADVHANVREEFTKRYGRNVDPAALNQALTLATSQFKDLETARKAREESVVVDVKTALVANGGRFDALSPQQRKAIPAEKTPELITFAANVNPNKRVETDWGLFYKLSTDPALLGSVQLDTFKDKLQDGEFKHLVAVQAKLKGPDAEEKTTNFMNAHQVFEQYLKQSGLTAKSTDKSGQEKIGTLTRTFQERLTAAEKTYGGKLNPTQINEVAASVFKPVETKGFLWDSKAPAGLVGAEMKVSVPNAEKLKIISALTRQGRAADDATVEDVYRRANGIPPLAKK